MTAQGMNTFPLYIGDNGSFSIRGVGTKSRNFAPLQIAQSISYKMRGRNTSTSQYETWITTSPDTPPPSGATLSDIIIASILADPSDNL